MTLAGLQDRSSGPVCAGPVAFYRPLMDAGETEREAEARARAAQRLRRQRNALRPVALVVIAAVVVGAVNGHPRPAAHGTGLAVALALVLFAVPLAFAVRPRFVALPVSAQAMVIAVIAGAGVALVALQPRGATDLAAGAAVWMAVARLPNRLGVPLALATTLALGLVLGLVGASRAAIAASLLLCGLLALTGFFIREARASQDTTELLLAQLEDAREEQLAATALAERSRIAAELHDVLAHALSGAALQLQGARKLAEREGASEPVRAAIDRAGELVREGLNNARQAVGALRGEQHPGVAELEALVTGFRNDTGLDATLTVEGNPRPLPAEASLALYRGAQEALTNISRYAPGAATSVLLRYDSEQTSLIVEDAVADDAKTVTTGLAGVGGGNGLAGLRERLERAGGRLEAGPTASGWIVQLEIPA
jgi:signal transduction histidine kinase